MDFIYKNSQKFVTIGGQASIEILWTLYTKIPRRLSHSVAKYSQEISEILSKQQGNSQLSQQWPKFQGKSVKHYTRKFLEITTKVAQDFPRKSRGILQEP